jgi:hypothetical protein
MKKSDVFNHFILTKFNCGIYDREDAEEWMNDRLKVWKKTRESVLKQKGDFQWVIAVDPRTPNEVMDEIEVDDRIRIMFTERGTDIKDYFEMNRSALTKPWIITSRLDSDDIYLPGTILAIQDAFQQKPGIVDIPYNQFYKGKRYPSHRDNPNSPFLSLIEASKYQVRTCYARPHNKMNQEWPSPRFVDLEPDVDGKAKPMAYMVIHEKNMANKLISHIDDHL